MTNFYKYAGAKSFIYALFLSFVVRCTVIHSSDGSKLKIIEEHIDNSTKNYYEENNNGIKPLYPEESVNSAQSLNLIRILRRKKRALNQFCITPVPTPDKNITFTCFGDEPCSTNGLIHQFTTATIECTEDYYPVPETNFNSICSGRNWIPPIDRCFKRCEKLNPVNVDLQCFRKGINIACDENLLLAGTRVRPTCKTLYKYGDFIPSYQEIVCREDGKWDKMLFSCVPECGRTYVNAQTLISNGTVEKFGEAPWHVAIYDQRKVLICGGTIISQQIVLSAAHCFYDTRNNLKLNAADHEIVVSKFNRNYSSIDNKYQKVYKINEIRFPEKGFVGLDNYFAADLAILILQEKIVLSPTILPACVEWIPVQKPPEGTLGKVSGWGLNEMGIYGEQLLTTNLPFISRQQCLNTVPVDFRPFVTLDKFCAGSETGPGVLQGDSGGGLLFRENNFYHIRGIVSLKQPTITAIATFTDIADHIDWILAVRNEVELEKPKEDVILPSKNIPTDCGISSVNSNESTPWHASIYYKSENRIKCGGTIISSQLIISAAHCFNVSQNLKQYEVVVNKMPRDRKVFKIKELRFFNTERSAADYDIVILILSEKIPFNSNISPVCIEWTRNSEFKAPEGTYGEFMGWVWYRNGTTTLIPQSLPFISHDQCVSKLSSSRFQSYVKYDKFCADLKTPYYATGAGSGFVFKQGGRFYIRGIMSIRAHVQTGVALFTDISYYNNFIITVLDE